MGLINLLLKVLILILDLRATFDCLDVPRLSEIGQQDRDVVVRKEDGTKETVSRRRVGGSKRKAAVKSALMTVLVWNIFHKIEPVCDRTVAWFVPFYDSIKTLFLLWLLTTRSYGAAMVMHRFILPFVRPYEGIIDGIIYLSTGFGTWVFAMLLSLGRKAASLVRGIEHQDEVSSMSSSLAAPPVRQRSPPSPPSNQSGSGSNSRKAKPSEKAPLRTTKRPPSKFQLAEAKKEAAEAIKTRKVLQDLPVPTHPFVATSVRPDPPATTSNAKGPEPPSQSVANKPLITSPGPAPSSPGVLRNYAFIPGMTPEAKSSSIISPTPKFPGGFSFSSALAPGQQNPFQAARIPPTSGLPPLTMAQTYAQSTLVLTQNVVPSRPAPVEGDDRIVAPPTLKPKASAGALRRRKADTFSAKGMSKDSHQASEPKRVTSNGAKSQVDSGNNVKKKRQRAEDDASELPTSTSTSPRKKAKRGDATHQNVKTNAVAPAGASKPKIGNSPSKAAVSKEKVSASSTAVRTTGLKKASSSGPVRSTRMKPPTTVGGTSASKSKEAVTASSSSDSSSLPASTSKPSRMTRSRTKQDLQ